ncbi:MAG: hypothetical protein DSO09_02455 [Candidatus Methanomethylicota archaeon]|jgi:hypothetical protein|uniref:Uncharacterized protein n=1 Tax=Thermoproteota archaeon TaxID=2056631 RepID=A0A520KFF8_9CREN|nr:MAG: hypothetical protein EF809_03510 [Candidatus Verstraetearchaeota archaeon]TDA39347.1 MAG: hypothetical protein DSO09_02455 [Candidatus Verstraetearchaeota archaeon]
MKVEGIIAIVADWEERSKYVLQVCEEVSKIKNIPIEIKKEDYDFLTTYGEKDEFGGVEIPQVFLKLKGGIIKHIMTRIPDNEKGLPDIEKAVKNIIEKIEEEERE